jgi:serine/threonine-protein kinase
LDTTTTNCGGYIDDICITHRLASSSAGMVFAGRQDKLGRDVAVKVIPKKIADENPALVKRLMRDTKIASRLTHPNIVRVYYAGETTDGHYVVMDLVKGISLEELVQTNGRLSPQRVAQIGREVAAALDYAHSSYGIAHGNIKPAHLIVDGDGDIKVIDLGFSHPSDMGAWANRTIPTGQPVSFNYMAPERLKYVMAPDCRCDIYSLGATLYYALCGQRPFGDGNPADTIKRITDGECMPLGQVAPSVPKALVDAVERMMATDPEKRFKDYAAVVQALTLPDDSTSSDDAVKIIAGDGVPKKKAQTTRPVIKSPDILDDVLESLGGNDMTQGERNLRRHRPPTEQILMGPKVKETGSFKRRGRAVLLTLGALLFVVGFAAGVATLMLLGFKPV